MLGKLKGLIGSLAPQLGHAIGGPLGGTAANMIAEALGCDPSPKNIEKALSAATPAELLKLKEVEKEFEVKMKELDVQIYNP